MTNDREFETFYRDSRDRLALHVAALTGDPAEALDHVQEAFIRAWARWEQVSRYDDPEAWVRRVAYNRAVSRWRRARRIVLRDDVGTESIHLADDQIELVDALRTLPEAQRRAVVLHHLVGYPVERIAAEMNAPTGTVKSWLSRGRARLARELDPEEENVDELR